MANDKIKIAKLGRSARGYWVVEQLGNRLEYVK